MFRAVNTELEDLRGKIEAERQRITNYYDETLEKRSYEQFFDFQVQYEENGHLLEKARSYIMYNYVEANDIYKLEQQKSKYDFTKYQSAFFKFISKNLDKNNFSYVKSLLSEAKEKKWLCNDYYDLKKLLYAKFYGENEI
ncbi:hypothetical protein NUSPORA_00049 [Nucleospora cyclopteri]